MIRQIKGFSMQRNIKKQQFTLLELLVAMAVFSVMMTVLMEFFSSAQRVTLRTKHKTEYYEEARLALDMITRDLKTSKYIRDDSKVNYSGPSGPLTFYSRSSFSDTPGKLVLVSYDKSGDNLTYSNDGGTAVVIAENVRSFEVEHDGGDKYLPNDVTVTLKIGEDDNNCNTFVKSVYIGGRGQ